MMYIIEKDAPFKGWVHSTVNKHGYVNYQESPIKFEDYNKEGRFKLIGEEELETLLVKHYKGFESKWEEITEERYYEMLEVLPPQRWIDLEYGVNIFFISEATTGPMHGCFIKSKGKYYESMRSIYETEENLLKSFKEDIHV